ncbi:hypothetical protein Hanom_Chr08g00732871 [Helianthus anomalus]
MLRFSFVFTPVRPTSQFQIHFNPVQSISMSGFNFKSTLGSCSVNGLARFSFDSVKPSQLGQTESTRSTQSDTVNSSARLGSLRCSILLIPYTRQHLDNRKT